MRKGLIVQSWVAPVIARRSFCSLAGYNRNELFRSIISERNDLFQW